ncbi:Pentatricopeptide repeat domain [Fragilaria crotonensis]|nr:Pentatricopeptide repeat domain [Fragilaria crotonensis]
MPLSALQVVVLVLLLCRSTAFLQRHPLSQSISCTRTSSLIWSTPTDDEEQLQRRQYAANNRASLRWVVQSIERNENAISPRPNPELVQALKDLEEARTQKRVQEVGLRLENMAIYEEESVFCQERVIKATAICGLLSISLGIFYSLLDKGHVPSDIAYTALCKSLRQARRVTELEAVLTSLGKASKTPLSPIALNTYLASLCDNVTKQDAISRRNLKIDDIGQLEKARALLKAGKAYKMFRIKPDESSYATVLHAAATVGNRAMVNEVWTDMNHEGVEPNHYAYNALMKAICNEGPDFDAEAINLLEHMTRNPFLQPDRFTIDLVLLPIARTEGTDRICTLLQEFVHRQRSQPKLLEQAFSSFLNTLVKGEEVRAARAVFNNILLPQLDEPLRADFRLPNVRHFNIVLHGLRNSIARTKSTLDKEEMRKESARLYQCMLNARIRPDEYTITILMGMVKSSAEIMSIVRNAVVGMGVDVTPVVLRSILAACGEVNDPSSACWLFDTFQGEINDSKTWNALLGALSASAEFDSHSPLNIASSEAALVLSQDFAIAGSATTPAVASFLDGTTCPKAATLMLKMMSGYLETPFRTPPPNTQTYCLVASALQHEKPDSAFALALFQNATNANIPADGRFVNAIFRCCGSDIDGALNAWKGGIRQACLAAEGSTQSKPQRSTSKNLLAAYQGLLYVCGRALRPDIALRIVYAMNKEGVPVNEMALQCFQAGKRTGIIEAERDESQRKKAVAFCEQFESLLLVECTKYDANDKRREGDKRVRIIL